MIPQTRFIALFTCLLLLPLTLISQDSLQYRKLYLHSDREHYFLGDTLWYKAYYLDGQRNTFIPGIISLYVDLINEQGTSLIEQVVALDNGASSGAIQIPERLEAGNYMLRAFTDFQKKIGEEAFFYKQVKIAKLESFVEGANQAEQKLPEEIFLDFLPEGGILLEGQMNTIALKATDAQGREIPLEGEILNNQGNTVAQFKTSYKGMGSFKFRPVQGERYRALTVADPQKYYPFPDALQEGIKLEFEEEDTDGLHLRVVTNASSYMGRDYYFAISHRGEVIFLKKFVPKWNIFPITVNKDALGAGINRMVLMDEQLLPISDRLYFSTNYQINEIRIKADKQAYKTRSKVRLKLSDGKDMDESSWSHLSMAVVDEFATVKEGPSMNILSWLLIDSELKGQIDAPLGYFSDDPELSSASKLDLLMMTQGWSRYVWNHPEEFLAGKRKDREGYGLFGRVYKVIGNKPANEGSIELKIYNSSFIHADEVDLDQEGRFLFRDISFMDTASVFIQAKNKNDKPAFKVELDPIFEQFPGISVNHLPFKETFNYRQAELYQKQYDNLQALKDYTLKSGAFYLDEVTITEQRRPPGDGHFRIYAKPSNSIQITERDVAYLNVLDYIKGRFAGVIVSKKGDITIRGPSGFTPRPPLLLLDGLPVNKEVYLSIPMDNIDRVEVLKNPGETAIFGTRGGSGVVSVFTKKGKMPDYSETYTPGTIAEKLAGYASCREFYSPAYTKENIHSERPDHRIVSYWNPNIFTEKGKAAVSFFSSDDISRYKVYVEGITREGKICLGTTSFDVDKRNDQLSLVH